MKSLRVILVVLVVLGVVGWQSKNLVGMANDWRGRTIVYPEKATVTRYPGVGEIVEQKVEQIFVMPKGQGAPFFVSSTEKDEYSEELYELTMVPVQEYLVYSVGKVQKWESISGSRDKYMVVKNPNTRTLARYRIAFEKSDLFKLNMTGIAVEDTNKSILDDARNEIKMPEVSGTMEIGFDNLKKLILPGDTVVLRPVLDPPVLSKKDENGNYLVSMIVLRRNGGVGKLNSELNKLGDTK